MNRKELLFLLAVVVFVLPAGLQRLAAEEKSAADLFPASTIAYLEMTDPNAAVEVILKHPLRAKIEALDDIQKQMKSDEYQQFLMIVTAIERQIGMSWRKAINTVTHDGLYIGVDAKTEGLAILLKSNDEEKLSQLYDKFIELARAESERKGNGDRIESKDYRGIKAHKVDKGILAQTGRWLLMSNKGDLAKAIADAVLDGQEASLASNDNFKSARDSMSGSPTAWGYLNVSALRDAGMLKDLVKEKNDNPGIEFLAGGIIGSLANTPYLTFTLDFNSNHIKLAASMPHDRSSVPKRREFFFGADGEGVAPTPLLPKQTLLSIESFRDIGKFWLAKEELFVENVVAQMAQADSQFSTFFSGLDFGQEVLSALDPRSQFVLVRQSYEEADLPEPDIKLPAGAYIYRLKDPDAISQRLKVGFQSIFGLANLGLAQQGQPQFDVNTEKVGDARIISASYIVDDVKEGLINYNFSPTIVFVDNWLILSSTKSLAHELAKLATDRKDDERKTETNTRSAIDFRVLEEVLADNEEQLVARNVLEKGHSKADAEKEIGTLLNLLKSSKDLSLQLLNSGDALTLQWKLRFAEQE